MSRSRVYRTKEQARLYWQQVVQRWRKSGLSVRQFCCRHQIREPEFYNWRKKLSLTDPPPDISPSTDIPFVQVDMDTGPQSPMTLTLACGHTLHIANQVHTETLATVLQALLEAKPC